MTHLRGGTEENQKRPVRKAGIGAEIQPATFRYSLEALPMMSCSSVLVK